MNVRESKATMMGCWSLLALPLLQAGSIHLAEIATNSGVATAFVNEAQKELKKQIDGQTKGSQNRLQLANFPRCSRITKGSTSLQCALCTANGSL